MSQKDAGALHTLPSVDAVLRDPAAEATITQFGRTAFVAAVRKALAEAREGRASVESTAQVVARAQARLHEDSRMSLRAVFNLTGTVLHTNLGRAIFAEAAVEAAIVAMREAVALEFDVDGGQRGERDDHVRNLLCELTGAEDATIVNNNAAAVLLVLNTLAKGKDAIVSRGELIEIGGAFRMPDIMARAGAKLVEVGTTNRTHLKDYAEAISARTGLVLKVHTSNFRIEGFTKEVSAHDLAALTKARNVPLVNDLGSGVMVDLARFGMAHEPTILDAVSEGADLVTFSGDKLLGGPQAGVIVGRKDLIARINKNPMKRALRVDKVRLAALEATLKLYKHPERLAETIPALRMLARTHTSIEAAAHRLAPIVAGAVGAAFAVDVVPCHSQIGSGALPVETLPSAGLEIRTTKARGARQLIHLSKMFRALPYPVVGRIADGALIFDLRCLADEQESAFVENLSALSAGLV